MRTFLRVLPLAAFLLIGTSSTDSVLAATTSQSISRIPQEWWEGWNAGRRFVASVNAQYGAGSIQSQAILQAELEVYLPDGADFNDMEDGYDKGYAYALIIALR